jgi:hypothetical protein
MFLFRRRSEPANERSVSAGESGDQPPYVGCYNRKDCEVRWQHAAALAALVLLASAATTRDEFSNTLLVLRTKQDRLFVGAFDLNAMRFNVRVVLQCLVNDSSVESA